MTYEKSVTIKNRLQETNISFMYSLDRETQTDWLIL